MRPNARIALSLVAALWTVNGLPGPARAPGQQRKTCDAVGYLSTCLKDPERVMIALATLKSAGEDEALPIFQRGLQSAHEPVRIYCLDAVADIMEDKAVGLLTGSLKSDESANVRAAALSRLMELDAAKPEMLTGLLNHKNEKLRCLTACALVRLGKGAANGLRTTLEGLTESTNPATEIMARVSLVKLGDTTQLAAIRRRISNPRVPEVVIALMCEQISDQNVTEATGLLTDLAGSRRSMGIRARALDALAEVSPAAPGVLLKEITEAKNPVYAARLMKLLADQDDATKQLLTLARADGSMAPLARFELARKNDHRALAGVTRRAIAGDSLLPAAYIIARAEQDANSQTLAPAYVPALSEWLTSLDGRSKTFKPEHLHAAKATTVLVDIGLGEGLQTVHSLLNSRYSARTQAVAMGLVKAENSKAIALAGPLLDSAYPKLVRSAAMTLGRYGRESGREELVRIATAPQREGVPTACLANWYILKIDGETKVAARTLAGVLP
ncbi:MAG: HEAT repeat domain-containing protein [Planctomycetota bacterium]